MGDGRLTKISAEVLKVAERRKARLTRTNFEVLKVAERRRAMMTSIYIEVLIFEYTPPIASSRTYGPAMQ